MATIEEDSQTLQGLIDQSHKIVFFGGAGVSTESGIPDFRSKDGLYRQKYKYDPEEIISAGFFQTHTEEFYEFYKEKMLLLDKKPNAAHRYLADLEKAGKLTAIVTQNIDGLHQAAGSKNVIELHGSVHRNYCTQCGAFYDGGYVKNSPETIPTCRKCHGIIKPDVVFNVF
jgi:NAD-dependent deacetylase